MNYDRELFEIFRKLAITDVDDFVIGNVFYRYAEKFTLTHLETTAQYYLLCGLRIGDLVETEFTELRWYRGITEEGYKIVGSLRDNNIGASYNPWLIFSNEDIYRKYTSEFIPTVRYGDWPRYF